MLTCKTVPANTDVVGKGIRVNFYLTIFLIAVIPRIPSMTTVRLLNALYMNAGISGIGLLLTAIIQTAKNQLSLFHAICVLHLLWFLGIKALPMGKYRVTRGRIIIAVLLRFALVITYTGWALYVWIHVKTYGSHPECNDHIKYVMMFVTVRATAPWLHRFWMAGIIMGTVTPMIEFYYSLRGAAVMNSEVWSDSDSEGDSEGDSEEDVVVHSEIDTGICRMSTVHIFLTVYAAVNLELTVRQNKAKLLPDGTNVGRGVVEFDDSWQFGQVLAVVMIISNVNEIVRFAYSMISHYCC